MGEVKGTSPPLCRFCKVRHFGLCITTKPTKTPKPKPGRKAPKQEAGNDEDSR